MTGVPDFERAGRAVESDGQLLEARVQRIDGLSRSLRGGGGHKLTERRLVAQGEVRHRRRTRVGLAAGREDEIEIAALHARVEIGEFGQRARIARRQPQEAVLAAHRREAPLPDAALEDVQAIVAAAPRKVEFETADRLPVRAGRRRDLHVEVEVFAAGLRRRARLGERLEEREKRRSRNRERSP